MQSLRPPYFLPGVSRPNRCSPRGPYGPSVRFLEKFRCLGSSESFYGHRAPARATHWINALCLLFLLGSGLDIFNAHPRLYWCTTVR